MNNRVLSWSALLLSFLVTSLASVGNSFALYFAISLVLVAIYYGSWRLGEKWEGVTYSLALSVFTVMVLLQVPGVELSTLICVSGVVLIAYRNWRLQAVYAMATIGLLVSSVPFSNTLQLEDVSTVPTLLSFIVLAISSWWSNHLGKMMESMKQKDRALQKLDSVKDNIRFAEEMSKGNLDYASESAQVDELGRALLVMRENLLASRKRELAEKFVNVGVNKVGEILRAYTGQVDQLCDELVREIVKYVNANQGAIFLAHGEHDDLHLKMASCYAYERKKYLNKRIELGEGMLGQCFLERDVIHLKKVPHNFVHITSGLGEATPSAVLLVPIQTQDEIVGVLELASFQSFTAEAISLLRKLGEIIASSVSAVRTTEKMRMLVQESQKIEQILKARDEEARQTVEQLRATQTAMQLKANELEAYIRSIDDTVAQIEFDTNGIILTANRLFTEAMGYSLDEIKGRHHRMFITEAYANSQEYQNFWKNLAEGQALRGEFRRLGKYGKPITLNATYTPVVDLMGKVQRVIKLAQISKIETIETPERNNTPVHMLKGKHKELAELVL